MNEATFTFRVEEDLKQAFASAARSRDRNGAQLLREFMRDFVRQQLEAAEHDAWFRDQVRAGRRAADAGEVLPAEEVEAEASAWGERMLASSVQKGRDPG
jgi:predicted transcriptional regulator